MPKSFSPEERRKIVKAIDGAARFAAACRKHGIDEPTYYAWKNNQEPSNEIDFWSFIDPYLKKVKTSTPEAFEKTFARVPAEARNLIASNWCRVEVENGGFHQFFRNPTGVLAPEAAAGFRALKLPRAAKIVDEAIRFWGKRYPRARDARQKVLARYQGEDQREWDPFFQLNQPFYNATLNYDSVANKYATRAKEQASKPRRRSSTG
jgi:transposase-like protein